MQGKLNYSIMVTILFIDIYLYTSSQVHTLDYVYLLQCANVPGMISRLFNEYFKGL